MLQDCHGNIVSTTCPDTLQAFEDYTSGFLSYGKSLPRIFEAADADPGCCAAQAHAAAVHLAFEAASGFRKAEPYLERARALAPSASLHDQTFVRAVSAWADRDLPASAAMLAQIVEQWPEDIAAGKWGQYHFFNLGDQEGLLAITEKMLEAHHGKPFIHGMHAFALEQAHRLEDAEEAGRLAVEIERADPWAHHAVAHVMETQGRVEEGLTWMTGFADTWDDRGFFIQLHNWWHIALFQMDMDNHDAVLELFDRRLIDVYPDFCQEQIGAISALWRLELRGVDVGPRWDQVIARVRERELEHVLPFHDMHYVHALGRAGSGCECDTFMLSMEHHADRLPAPWNRVWKEVAVPLGYGIAEHALGRFETAARYMGQAMPRLAEIGGSHAQRDIFEQTYIDALIRSGQTRDAEPLVRARHEARPDVPVTGRLLEMIRAG